MTGIVKEQNPENKIGTQMGCMAGFFQIFDRHHILTGKRLHTIKRLPSKASRETTSEQENNVESPAISKEKEQQPQGRSSPSPEPSITNKSPCRLSIFEFNKGSTTSPWKFSKEAPRLSLDSRAVVDANGSLKPRQIRTNAAILSSNQCESIREEEEEDKQRCSTSVVARLMGLEAPLPDSDTELNRKKELRRSSSEARGRDLFQYRFVDGVNFPNNAVTENGAKQDEVINNASEERWRNARAEPVKTPVRRMVQRKRFYDSVEFFPEAKHAASIYGEIEKRLKLRGINEALKDFENLKQVLESLQLKGLLHTTESQNQRSKRNFVYEHEQSPIFVIKPVIRRTGNDSPPSTYRSRPGGRLNSNCQSPPAPSLRRDRQESERTLRNQSRVSGVKSPNRKPLRIETQRGNGNAEQRKVSSVQSAKVNVRGTGLDQTTNRSPVNRKLTAEINKKEGKDETSTAEIYKKEGKDETSTAEIYKKEGKDETSTAEIYKKEGKDETSTAEIYKKEGKDETSTASECSISSSSQTDTERSKVEEYKEGRSLLERCDKLLNSIAEMTKISTELQQSPVSVLDSSFYKDDSSPSPVMRRIDFKDQFVETEDEIWSPASAMSSAESKSSDKSDDYHFIYISDILRASNYLPDDTDVFSLLEKQQYLKGKDTSKVYRLQRKLIFDTINAILKQKGRLPPWKLNRWSGETSLQQIWSEFQKLRERNSSDDLFEVICGELRKDLAGDAINSWEDCPIEMSEAVLDIERLIFKDLIVEIIRELTDISAKGNKTRATRRKLVF